jgi:hypothetical protein
VKAYLPYKVNFGLEVIGAERPRRILSRLSKDFGGTGEWVLEETADATVATLDWRPSVNHALIRHLTPALRPLSGRITTGRCATANARSVNTSARRSQHGDSPWFHLA